MTEATGFIGLGHLGLPMATNLLESGYPLSVYNRTESKAEPLRLKGAHVAGGPLETVTSGGIVVTMLWDLDAVEQVVESPGFLEKLGHGGVHLSMCTGSAEKAKALAALHAEHGSTYVEAPVFGRPEAAVARKLSFCVAGPQAAKERVHPLLTAMGGQDIFDFGEQIGAATTVKLIGNFLIISAVRSLVESLALAEKTGVDVKATVAMLTQTLFPAPIYQGYGKMIVDGTLPFSQSGIPEKDLGLFQAMAQQVDLPTPLAQALLALIQRPKQSE